MCGSEEVLAYWRRLLTPLPLEIALPADRPHPSEPAPERESLEALAFVGEFERARHSDFFFLNSPTSTRA